MGLQALERKLDHPVWSMAPVTNTVSGFDGARIVTAWSNISAVAVTVIGYATATTATNGISLRTIYYAGANGYDDEFAANILKADAAAPEAEFNNVVDMLDWLNRE